MSYLTSSSGGYASSGGGYVNGNSETSATYMTPTKRIRVRMIGCTCGGREACRGTCRTPIEE